jgi:hypothetical protein
MATASGRGARAPPAPPVASVVAFDKTQAMLKLNSHLCKTKFADEKMMWALPMVH